MAKPAYKRKQYRRTYIREWRKHRGLTLEQLAGRIDATPSSLSLLERGQSAYTQGTLEAVAEALGTTPWSLLSVHPEKEGLVIDLFQQIDEKDRDQALRVLRTFSRAN